MGERVPHVRSEMRRVYLSPRGAKQTKHAAYIAVAKAMIAAKCGCQQPEFFGPSGDMSSPGLACAYHQRHECDETCRSYPHGDDCDLSGTMPYYMRVKARLIARLKYTDKRLAESPEPREGDA